MTESIRTYGSEPTGLKAALEALESKLVPPAETLRRLSGPDLAATREFVHLLDRCIGDLNQVAGLEDERAVLIRQSVLQGTFPVFVCYRHRLPHLAAELLIRQWMQVAEVFGALGAALRFATAADAVAEPTPIVFLEAEEGEFLTTFNTAVLEVLLDSETRGRGRKILRRLTAHLGLSYDQLGRMFHVSGETVRRWERGSHPIPDERLATLVEADGALTRLLEILRPERLRQVVRRGAGLFDGESALDWILRGRISEAAARYEAALSYQA